MGCQDWSLDSITGDKDAHPMHSAMLQTGIFGKIFIEVSACFAIVHLVSLEIKSPHLFPKLEQNFLCEGHSAF
jgi:hypothetical protein